MTTILVSFAGILIIIVLASQTISARRRASALERSFAERVQDWIATEKTQIVTEQSRIAMREAMVRLEEWKRQSEDAIRQDAIARSRSVIVGKVTEHLVPYLPNFPWNPKDARFVGAPVDLLVFDGLDEGQLRQILLVEVKTGSSILTPREKQIRDAINACRVGWRELRIESSASASLPSPRSPRQLPGSK